MINNTMAGMCLCVNAQRGQRKPSDINFGSRFSQALRACLLIGLQGL